MVLRRLTKHIADQNWFAVMIEFIIVVAGVALGYQLNAEFERRQRAAAEIDYLNGISSDYGVYQALLVCRTQGVEAIADGLIVLIEAIDGEPVSAEDRPAVLNALTFAYSAFPGLPIEGNTSALLAGALVETISDSSLRGRILAAQSRSTTAANSVTYITASLANLPRLDQHLTRDHIAEFGGYAVADFDLESLRADPQARDVLINLVNIQRSSQSSDRGLLGAVNRVLDRLVELGAREDSTPPERCPDFI